MTVYARQELLYVPAETLGTPSGTRQGPSIPNAESPQAKAARVAEATKKKRSKRKG